MLGVTVLTSGNAFRGNAIKLTLTCMTHLRLHLIHPLGDTLAFRRILAASKKNERFKTSGAVGAALCFALLRASAEPIGAQGHLHASDFAAELQSSG